MPKGKRRVASVKLVEKALKEGKVKKEVIQDILDKILPVQKKVMLSRQISKKICSDLVVYGRACVVMGKHGQKTIYRVNPKHVTINDKRKFNGGKNKKEVEE